MRPNKVMRFLADFATNTYKYILDTNMSETRGFADTSLDDQSGTVAKR